MKNFLMIAAIFLSMPVAAQTFPPLQGKPVLDAANIISNDDEAALNAQLFDIMKKSGHQVMVLTIRDLQGYPIDDFGYRAGRHYKIGHKGVHDGVLMTIAKDDRAMRIDVGYGLEPTLTDAVSGEILDGMKPYFRSGDYGSGIRQGVTQIGEIITPLTPEQIALKQRAAALAEQHERESSARAKDFFLTVFFVLLGLASAIILYWLATIPKRRREREAVRVAYVARQKEIQEARERENERQAILRRREAEMKEQEALARKVKLDAMHPLERAAFLRAEEAEKKAKLRRELDARNERIRIAEAQRAEERKRADKLRRENEERTRSSEYIGYETSRSSNNYSSNWDSTPSPSPSPSYDFGGGGGSFGGGGASDSW